MHYQIRSRPMNYLLSYETFLVFPFSQIFGAVRQVCIYFHVVSKPGFACGVHLIKHGASGKIGGLLPRYPLETTIHH